jgi:hypothetical protein
LPGKRRRRNEREEEEREIERERERERETERKGREEGSTNREEEKTTRGLTVALQAVFGVSKFDLGTLVYDRIRDQMIEEDPDPKNFSEEKNFYERSTQESRSWTLYFKKARGEREERERERKRGRDGKEREELGKEIGKEIEKREKRTN